MKRILSISLFLLLAWTGICFAAAAGTCVQGTVTKAGDKAQLIFLCTASTDQSFPSTAVNAAGMAALAGYWIDEIVTYPGGTAPTDGTAVAVTMSPGSRDILGSRGVCSSTVAKAFLPVRDTISTALGGKTITGTITVAITGNVVASAIVNIVITAWRN